jgi:hypothetical protein
VNDLKQVVYSNNDRYDFWIEGVGDSSTYALKAISTPDNESSSSNLKTAIAGSRKRFLSLPFHIGLTSELKSVLEAAKDPKFSITSSSATSLDGQPCIVLEWRYLIDPGCDPATKWPVFPEVGKLWIDPANDWVLIGFEWALVKSKPQQFFATGRFADFVNVGGAMIPRMCTVTFSGNSPQDQVVESFEYEFSKDVDVKEFYLPYYGLIEPEGVKKPASVWPWWIKLSVAGVVAFGIAAIFKRSINKGKN